jgi:hypothetical protein
MRRREGRDCAGWFVAVAAVVAGAAKVVSVVADLIGRFL